MDGKKIRIFLLIILFCFSNSLLAQKKYPFHLYMGLSGGYGESDNAYRNTGANSLIRFQCGSYYDWNKYFTIGEETGFQGSNQIRLDNDIVAILGSGSVPISLNMKTPVDFLIFGRVRFYEPLFVQAKGGMVFIPSSVTGYDVESENAWLPEMQIGMGIDISDHSRISLNIQKFFGTQPVLTILDLTQGTAMIRGIPIWIGGLLTFEISI